MREFVGKVVSNRMTKSVLVAVERWKPIPKYKRIMRRHKKFMAHDERNDCNIGDIVKIVLCRPLSRNKCWIVTDILRREKVFDAEAAAANARGLMKENRPGLDRGFAASA